jgi:hypothetical protein
VLTRHRLQPADLAIEIDPALLGDRDPLVVANLAGTLAAGIGVILDRPASWGAVDTDADRMRCTGIKVDAGTADPAELASLVARCDEAGLLVVADGITSAESLEVARSAGCHLGQGPWLAVAQAAATLPARVSRRGLSSPR